MRQRFIEQIRATFAFTTICTLAACGGAGGTVPHAGAQATTAPYDGPTANATFSFKIPVAAPNARRKPNYISSATKSIKVTLNSASALTSGQVTSYNSRSWGTLNTGTLPNTTCPASGPFYSCTMTLALPPGSDNLTFTTYDNTNGTGNVLSQQEQTLTITVGQANTFSVTFDANANTMTIASSTNFCQSGNIGAVFGSVGTSPVSFAVSYTDAAGKTILSPGLPKLEIEDNTSTYQTSSGTINGTGGTVAFSINQSSQSFTLTPSSSTITGATVNIKAVPQNTNGTTDGLSFSKTQSFTFSTGTAPPTHNFLAAIQQTGTGSGEVDLYTIALGSSGSTDTFTAYSPATLAVTNSTNEGQSDVNNPTQVLWDKNGDLLISNAGTSSVDAGNLACVPEGAIATGASTSTTVSTNAYNAQHVAYDSTTGTAALANGSVSANYQLPEYTLNGNYTASTNNLKRTGFGTYDAIDMPSLTAGTFAVSIVKGAEEDTSHGGTAGTNYVTLFGPTGTQTDISDDTNYSVDEPYSLAWDAANSQLVIANFSTWHRLLSFYTVSGTPALVKTINTTYRNFFVAASPDGHIAVAYEKQFGFPQVQIYDNTSSRNTVGGPIPFNGTTTSCGSTYIYGDGVTINGMTWLSSTKLLVMLEANNSSGADSFNGMYIYDISATATPSGYDDISCSTFSAAPKQTGFQHMTEHPWGVAFKP